MISRHTEVIEEYLQYIYSLYQIWYMGICIDNVDLQLFIVILKNIQKLRFANYDEVHEFISRHSHIVCDHYTYVTCIYQLTKSRINCIMTELQRKNFLKIFHNFGRVIAKSEFLIRISTVYQSYYLVDIVDMRLINHTATLIIAFEVDMTHQHGHQMRSSIFSELEEEIHD